MADGVFDKNFGDTIQQALLMRYQAQQGQKQQAQRSALEQMKLRAGLLGRLTLGQPGGGPVPASTYLAGINGPLPEGLTAEPTPAFVGAARDTTQKGIAGDKEKTENLKAATAQRAHWAQMLSPGETKPASHFAPGEILKQYGIDPSEKISSSQKPAGKGAGGGSTDPRLANLKAQEKTAKDEFEAAVKKIKDNTLYHAADHDALVEKQKTLGEIRQKMKALQGDKGDVAEKGSGDFDALYKKHGLK